MMGCFVALPFNKGNLKRTKTLAKFSNLMPKTCNLAPFACHRSEEVHKCEVVKLQNHLIKAT
jgi:hypothetical protein